MTRHPPSKVRDRRYLKLGSAHQRSLPTLAQYHAIGRELGITPAAARNVAMIALGKVIERAQQQGLADHCGVGVERRDPWLYA